MLFVLFIYLIYIYYIYIYISLKKKKKKNNIIIIIYIIIYLLTDHSTSSDFLVHFLCSLLPVVLDHNLHHIFYKVVCCLHCHDKLEIC